MIHDSVVIDPSAKVADNVSIAPYSIIGPGVEIGSGTNIGSHVVIAKNTKIGRDNKIHDFAALGGDPQHLNFKEEDQTYLEIGDHNIIREFCTIHRGTIEDKALTRVGNQNFLMAYSHVAHDCLVGNQVILANNASLAGHVVVNDFAIFGAFCAAHQYVTVGEHSFLGRTTKVGQDIPPYLLVTGNPGAPRGINLVGLKRRGFSEATIRVLKKAYAVVYRNGLMLKDALKELDEMITQCPELSPFVAAIKNSKRGIAR